MTTYDLPSFSVDTTINASAQRVWELASDLAVQAAGSDEFEGGEWLDDGDPARVGSRFLGRQNNTSRGEWETTSTVVETEPGRCFVWAVGSDPSSAAATWRFDMTEMDGVTTIAQTCQLGPGPSGLTAIIDSKPELKNKIIASRVSSQSVNMTNTLAVIKQRAEA